MISIFVLYHSQEYGNSAAMAEVVAAGAKVTLITSNEKRFDVKQLQQFDAVAFGSLDYWEYITGRLKVFVDDWHITRKFFRLRLEDKPYGLFYSHSGGGTIHEPFKKLFKSLRISSKIGKTIESYGKPNKTILEICRKLGRQLIKSIKRGEEE